MLSAILVFICVGVVGGFVSGLLGLGGGVIIVPLLTIAFTSLGVAPDVVYRLAIGTSMASIIFTSMISARSHNRIAPLRWDMVKPLAPYLVVGTLLGTSVATRVDPSILKIFFTLFIYSLAIRMLFNLHLKPRKKPVPKVASGIVGTGIGGVCSMIGIGGGTLIVPFLTWNTVPIHSAIGASAALGFFISISGAVGYTISGFANESLPWGAFGYVHIPALIAIAGTAIFCAPLGVKVAHKLTPRQLKIVFGVAMMIIGTGMLAGILKEFYS